MLTIPEDFAQRMRAVHGAAGEDWIERLPGLIETCEEKWGITVTDPHPELSYNYLTAAEGDGGDKFMLKIGVPHTDLFTEMEALRLFDGEGCVRLLQCERDLGAMLLEYVTPGTRLAALVDDDDERATRIACGVMKRLWRPVPKDTGLRTIAGLVRGLDRLRERFDGGTGPFPPPMFEKAERLFEELLESTLDPALLHGDFHHDNILASGDDDWIAIDAKGVIGDRAYGVSAFLYNPIGLLREIPDPRDALERRVEIFASELHLDKRRILGWAYAFFVLSGCWSEESNNMESVDYCIACVELIDSLLDQ